jgi:hypothetical protein
MSNDFAEKFCRQFKVPPTAFRAALLSRTLYPAARFLRPLLTLLNHDYFAADHSYIDSVGRIRRLRELANESHEFAQHPANRSFLRSTLRLRISVGRMHDLVHAVMNDVVAR